MQFDDRTPVPVPVDPRQQATGAIIVHSPHPFGEWWKQLVAICVGLAAVGGVLFAIGRQFFVSRDEWTTFRESVYNYQSQSREYHQRSDECRVRLDELKKEVELMKIRWIELDARNSRRH